MDSLDTNVILRFLLNDIAHETIRARQLIANSPVYVSDVVLTETIFVLEKSLLYDRPFICASLLMFLSLNGVACNNHIVPKAIKLFEKKPALSFVDCYAAVEAEVFGAKLYTFDKKLINQGGPHVVALS